MQQSAAIDCACRWSCLHRQPALEIDARLACHFIKPQLLSFYCDAARFVNATCLDPAYVPLPVDGTCPTPPSEGVATCNTTCFQLS
jgi:hypothetical protein